MKNFSRLLSAFLLTLCTSEVAIALEFPRSGALLEIVSKFIDT